MFSFPYDGNQPTTTDLFENFQNPSSSSISLPHDDHHIFHHNNYSQPSDLQGQLAPNFLEHDGLLLSYLLSHQQLLVGNSTTATATTTSNEISAAGSNSMNADVVDHEIAPEAPKASTKKAAKAPRKRLSGKKDRHSKIYTAQGPRDRRMRLSLQIARKFFDLQDMLRFDKASKTIEWLLEKSKTAIKDLKHHFNYDTSPSAAAEESGDYGSTSNNANAKVINSSNINSERTTSEVVYKTTSMKKNRKMCVVAKESRDEARARARERTREKTMRSRGLFDCPIHNYNGHQVFETAGMVGRSNTSSGGGGARSFLTSEDSDFLGVHGNWGGGIINNHKNDITGNNTVQLGRHKPSSSSNELINPSSIFTNSNVSLQYSEFLGI